MTYGSNSYGSNEDSRILYWAVQPSSTTNWPDNPTGADYIAAGLDGTGAALSTGKYGSQPYITDGVIDMADAASNLTSNTSYEFGYVIYDVAKETYSNIVVSPIWTTNA